MGRVIHGVARVGVPDIVGFPRRYAVDEFVRTQAALGGVPIVVVQEFVPLAIGRLRVFQISRVNIGCVQELAARGVGQLGQLIVLIDKAGLRIGQIHAAP